MRPALLAVVTGGCIAAAFYFGGALGGAFALLGFAIGLLVGLEWKDAAGLFEAHHPTTGDHPMPHMPHVRFPNNWLIYVIAAVQAAVAGLLIYVIVDQKGYETCMARWQQASTISTNARAEANSRVQATLDEIVLTIPDGDRSAFRKAVTAYIEEREKQKQERVKNPIPPLPETVCGEVR